MKVVALGTCHNRREATLRALHMLERQIVPGNCDFRICVVDDGSTDGTSEAITQEFPSIALVKGTGELFWAGGMRYGWDHFVRDEDPDYVLAFNDDIEPSGDALSRLLEIAGAIESGGGNAFAVSGALRNPDTGTMTYGGGVRKRGWHPLRFERLMPTAALQGCDTVNMNLTLISRPAIRLVGFLSPDFTHGRADYDFALRLRAAGGRVFLAPGFFGTCRVNPAAGTSRQQDLSLKERWNRLTGVKEQPPRERAVFYRRHAGWLWPFFWALPYLRVGAEAATSFVKRTLSPRRR